MSAQDNITRATYALDAINGLIVDESTGDDADSSSDVVTLRAAQKLLTDYITATADEVGTPEDLEDISDDRMNSLIRTAAGYCC